MQVVMSPVVSRKTSKLSDEQVSRLVKLRALVATLAKEAGLEPTTREAWVKYAKPGRALPRISVEESRVCLIGFTITGDPRVEQLTAEEAKAAHLGHVRGIVDLKADGVEAVLKVAVAAVSK